MAENTLKSERKKELTRDELDRLLEQLGLSADTATAEYRSRVESFNKLTLWQDQRNSQIAQLSAR